ncbi:MAG: hypothetical protein MJA31_02810 [Clostridia bacterium]|nr:hypothetical protein [Clostridia bacterium]
MYSFGVIERTLSNNNVANIISIKYIKTEVDKLMTPAPPKRFPLFCSSVDLKCKIKNRSSAKKVVLYANR